jgi:excisionase family DNA binding protein
MSGQEFLTVPQTAELLGLKRSRCYELVAAGQIPATRQRGRRILVPRRALEAYCVAQAEVAIDNLRKPRRTRKREPETDRPLSERGGS